MNTKYYHYTAEITIEKILKSKKIKQATAFLSHKEKPCTWVSSNQVWENTASKMAQINGLLILLTFEEHLKKFGCARIEVKQNNLYQWPKLKHVARIDHEKAKQLEEIGIERGANPMEWFGSLYPIGMDQWIKIEVYKNGEWIEYKGIQAELK